jgi:hypothetical protein
MYYSIQYLLRYDLAQSRTYFIYEILYSLDENEFGEWFFEDEYLHHYYTSLLRD